MNIDLSFILTSVLTGVAMAMDTFSVSMANGLSEPGMKKKKIYASSAVFSTFQIVMPLIGWFCVHKIEQLFEEFSKFIPWIALVLLCYIGGKMLFEGIKDSDGDSAPALTFKALIVQGVATSIDALSVGFETHDYNFAEALVFALIIGAVTYIISLCGFYIGKKFGTKLAGKASILGGVILIGIGVKIFLEGIL